MAGTSLELLLEHHNYLWTQQASELVHWSFPFSRELVKKTETRVIENVVYCLEWLCLCVCWWIHSLVIDSGKLRARLGLLACLLACLPGACMDSRETCKLTRPLADAYRNDD